MLMLLLLLHGSDFVYAGGVILRTSQWILCR